MCPLRAEESTPIRSFCRWIPRNILFICGGAFDGIEKIIESRTDRKSIGFGGDVATKQDRDSGILLNELQPHDLLKFGLIPELIGRLPVITTLRALDRDQLVEILTSPRTLWSSSTRSCSSTIMLTWSSSRRLWRRPPTRRWSVALAPGDCGRCWRRR